MTGPAGRRPRAGGRPRTWVGGPTPKLLELHLSLGDQVDGGIGDSPNLLLWAAS
nr:hypothetical protein OG781_07965 [Streptomyces sp. NBC_00830]